MTLLTPNTHFPITFRTRSGDRATVVGHYDGQYVGARSAKPPPRIEPRRRDKFAQLGNPLAPARAAVGADADDGTARRHGVQQCVGKVPHADEVDFHRVAPAVHRGEASAVEQRVHRGVNFGESLAD